MKGLVALVDVGWLDGHGLSRWRRRRHDPWSWPCRKRVLQSLTMTKSGLDPGSRPRTISMTACRDGVDCFGCFHRNSISTRWRSLFSSTVDDFHDNLSSVDVHLQGILPGLADLETLGDFRALRLHDDDKALPVGGDASGGATGALVDLVGQRSCGIRRRQRVVLASYHLSCPSPKPGYQGRAACRSDRSWTGGDRWCLGRGTQCGHERVNRRPNACRPSDLR